MKGLNINTTILETKDFLTIEDLTEAFKVSQYTIYRICNKGELKPYKFMRRNYWKSAEVRSYLDSKGMFLLSIKKPFSPSFTNSTTPPTGGTIVGNP